MNKKKIAVIFGGCSPEYKVSLESAYSVITNIDKEKYDIVLIGITKDGEWFKYDGDYGNIKSNTWYNKSNCKSVIVSNNRSDKGIIVFENGIKKLIKLDAVFPVVHGKNGEDGTLQGIFELVNIPIIGCDVLSSSLCMDKYMSHKMVQNFGINVAKNIVVDINEDKNGIDKKLSRLNYPLFVKPMRAGSSFGITKVDNKNQVIDAINKAFLYDEEVIIEENVEGIEVGCAIFGNEELVLGEVDEIELSNGFFDYTEKYTLKTSKIHVPARIDKTTSNMIKEVAKRIYKILKCKDFARVDMFLTPNGEVYFNEINTIPGFTTHSRYPTMMKKVGIEFSDLVNRLIELEV